MSDSSTHTAAGDGQYMSKLFRVFGVAAVLAAAAFFLWPRTDEAVNSSAAPASASVTAPPTASAPGAVASEFARALAAGAPAAPRVSSPAGSASASTAGAASAQSDPFKAFIEERERAKADAAKSPFARP